MESQPSCNLVKMWSVQLVKGKTKKTVMHYIVTQKMEHGENVQPDNQEENKPIITDNCRVVLLSSL